MLDDVPKLYKYLTFAFIIIAILAILSIVVSLLLSIFYTPAPSGPPSF